MRQIFEGRILRRLSGRIKENGAWRSRYNHGIYKLWNQPGMVKVTKTGKT
jgi:hypothetical protein